VLSEAQIERNTAGIEATLRALLAPPPGANAPEPLVVNNLDWFGAMPLLAFLRDIGEPARRR
jgi:tyrosyl-tRNA synthetase